MPINLIKIFYLLKTYVKILSHISCFYYTKCDKNIKLILPLIFFINFSFKNNLFIKIYIHKAFKIVLFSDNILLILDKKYQPYSLFI